MHGVEKFRKAVDEYCEQLGATLTVVWECDYWNGVTLRDFMDVLDEIDLLRAELAAAEIQRDEQAKRASEFAKTFRQITSRTTR